jgi:hypothetical protein
MPGKPYFHGGETFYLQEGALVAELELRGGVVTYKVVTFDRQYLLGHGITERGVFTGYVDGDDRRDRRHRLRSVRDLLRACQEVYGPRDRYAISPITEPSGLPASRIRAI